MLIESSFYELVGVRIDDPKDYSKVGVSRKNTKRRTPVRHAFINGKLEVVENGKEN